MLKYNEKHCHHYVPLFPVFVGDVDELLGDAHLPHAVPSVRDDHQVAVGGGLVQLPGGLGRAHHVIPPLDNVYGDLGQLVNILQDEAFLQEDSILKVMTLNPGKGSGKVKVICLVDVLCVRNQLASSHLPECPLSSCSSPDVSI